MSGLFVAIVGPSGAGKDSLIRELKRRAVVADLTIVRRVVTRQSDAYEDHDTLDEAAFAAAEREGRFALSWQAHSLKYGVPVAVDAAIAEGRTVIANISRAAVPAARERFQRCLVVLITACAETLAARLAARGREGEPQRERRLARAKMSDALFAPDATIFNEGALEEAAETLAALIAERRAEAAA